MFINLWEQSAPPGEVIESTMHETWESACEEIQDARAHGFRNIQYATTVEVSDKTAEIRNLVDDGSVQEWRENCIAEAETIESESMHGTIRTIRRYEED
jgi:L-rhamnose mutarotase